MDDQARLCLNVTEVKQKMKKEGLSIKDLAFLMGRDEHTVSRYFRQPDKIKLEDITAMGGALKMNAIEYDGLIRTAHNEEDYIRLKQK